MVNQQNQPSSISIALNMSRGNQRDTDRARAAKRAAEKGVKAKDKDGLTAAQRKERDAKALQEKAAKKAAAAGGEGN